VTGTHKHGISEYINNINKMAQKSL
jgi:hypothetical protein